VPLSPGVKLGPYEIKGRLGAGGMGEVWRAIDPRLGREVAIKVLPDTLSRDAGRRARLEREARAASALNHPNIVTVHEMAESDGVAYLVLERVQGQGLRELISSRALPFDKWLDLAVQVADGLAKAHAAGIVHRDLKPENVMVTPEGVVKILDFGLARIAQREAEGSAAPTDVQLTSAGQLLGTLAYMSPEQASGGRVDARSDQFSLGVMLYELATGRRPFDRLTPRETLAAILQEAPAPIGRLEPELPIQLRRVIERCLAKDPTDRYGSTRDLARDLRSVREDSVARLPGGAAPARRSLRVRATLAGLVTLAIVVAWLAASRWLARQPSRGATRIESIAVLPLANLSADPGQEFFADGMTEALITDLARIGSLRVISRTSVMQYKGAAKPLPQIARELGVDAILEGSVQRAGDRVRITAQLIRASSDEHLWAESYERDLRDVLSLQSEVSGAVARAVAAALTPEERARLAGAVPVEPAAYEAYLRGVELRSKATEADTRASLVLFERATTIDTTFAEAYGRVCDTYWTLGFTGWGALPPREAMPRARAACVEALHRDEALGGVHAVLGSMSAFYDWDARAAEDAFQRAVALSPSDPHPLQRYAWVLSAQGRHEEALALCRRAQALDPRSPAPAVNLGWLLYWARQYEASIVELRQVLDAHQAVSLSSLMLAVVHLQMGQPAEAALRLERAVTLAGGTSATVAQLAHAYALAGRRADAERLRSELVARAKREYVASYWLGLVEHGLGRDAAALDWLERAFDDREALPLLEVEPRWDGLRSNPRFQDLQRRVGFRRAASAAAAR